MTNLLDRTIAKYQAEARAEGRVEGRAEGRAEGREEIKREYEAALAEKDRAMKQLEQEIRELKLRYGLA